MLREGRRRVQPEDALGRLCVFGDLDFLDPVERLDAAINYDLTKNVTIGVEASNLTRSGDRSYWGTYDTPKDVKYFSRNFAFSLRARL